MQGGTKPEGDGSGDIPPAGALPTPGTLLVQKAASPRGNAGPGTSVLWVDRDTEGLGMCRGWQEAHRAMQHHQYHVSPGLWVQLWCLSVKERPSPHPSWSCSHSAVGKKGKMRQGSVFSTRADVPLPPLSKWGAKGAARDRGRGGEGRAVRAEQPGQSFLHPPLAAENVPRTGTERTGGESREQLRKHINAP